MNSSHWSVFCTSMLRADVTGSIFGFVKDKSQAVVAGAHVTVTNVETNLVKETTSGPDGEYRLLALPAGTYKVQASAPGFQDFETTGIDVKVNDRLKIDVLLEVGAVKQAVSVEANAVQVETETTQLGDVIETKKLLVAAAERAQLHRSAGAAGRRGAGDFGIHAAGSRRFRATSPPATYR